MHATAARRAVLLLLLSLCGNAHGAGLVVGFTNAQAVAGYPPSVMEEIAQFRWYFAHASVGSDMMGGLDDLHASSGTFYRLQSAWAGDTPGDPVENGFVFEYGRGNPGWQAKVDDFRAYVSNGWRFPKVNLVLDKMCYIDEAADVNYYIASMTNLEARFPETQFIYATMPLTTGEDWWNHQRNLYNDALRAWVLAHNRVLFDIADIEAHDAAGTEYTYVYEGGTDQRLYDGNTSDGGHLNTQGRRQVARGFYAVCRALLLSDRDGDGLSDGRELIAGTCSGSATSCFAFAEAPRIGGGAVVSWPSTSNRLYTLQRMTDLGAAPVTLLTNAAATPPFNAYTDTVASAAQRFYRVSVGQ